MCGVVNERRERKKSSQTADELRGYIDGLPPKESWPTRHGMDHGAARGALPVLTVVGSDFVWVKVRTEDGVDRT